jgi:2-hydroxychromene-2-carboxylate isomerase
MPPARSTAGRRTRSASGGHPAGDVPMTAERERAIFYYDFNSPYAYLAAERISALFSGAGAEQPIWQPIAFGFVIRHWNKTPWSMGPEKEAGMREIERRAAERGLPPVRWPDGWPVETYSLTPLRAAIFAGQVGKLVSFSLAAYRQMFAAGRDLAELDNVLLAAAACELHPKAVTRAIETRAVKDRLRTATEEAIGLGVDGVPTVAVGERLFWGDDRLEEAVAAAAS